MALLLSLAACSAGQPPVHRLEGRTMGTRWHVTWWGGGPTPAEARVGIERRLERLDAIFSGWRDDSVVSRFNRSRRTDWQPVPLELAQVVAVAQQVARRSDGAFDVTVAPLVDLWGFGPRPPQVLPPPADAVERARARVGYRRLEVRLDPPALRKRAPDVAIDLSAIAKGYAVDAIWRWLGAAGAANRLVEIGGEVRTAGERPGGGPWRVGIEQPLDAGRALNRVVLLRDKALATSGDYRNFFELDGERYAHVIDPHTGRPAGSGVASVSVVAPTTMEADALATALEVLGPPGAPRVDPDERFPVMFILRSKEGLLVRRSAPWRALESAVESP